MIRPIIVQGLAWGDESKGSCVDFLCSLLGPVRVSRYGGGHQCGHNVIRPDGTHHCFAQVGSGTFEGCTTYLSKYTLIEPEALLREIEVLESKGCAHVPDNLVIHPECVVVTPVHKLLNQLRETLRGDTRHGSCGCGVGEAWFDFQNGLGSTVGDLCRPGHLGVLQKILEVKLQEARGLIQYSLNDPEVDDVVDRFHDRLNPEDWVTCYEVFRRGYLKVGRYSYPLASIFEGAQGTLLDPGIGMWPHVTKTQCTVHNAMYLASASKRETPLKMGVLPAYYHRHGNGPFPTEDQLLSDCLKNQHNHWNPWQRSFRMGWFDAVLAKFAIDLNGGVDLLALAKLDQMEGLPDPKICVAYDYEGPLPWLHGVAAYNAVGETRARVHGILGVPQQGGDLSRVLERCTPVYVAAKKGDGYVRQVEELLQVRVGVQSYGPTKNDKKVSNFWL